MDKNYLSDIIYVTTQYLPLSDKEVAILNGRLTKAIWKGLEWSKNRKNKIRRLNYEL